MQIIWVLYLDLYGSFWVGILSIFSWCFYFSIDKKHENSTNFL